MPVPLKSGDYVAFHWTFSFTELLLYYSDKHRYPSWRDHPQKGIISLKMFDAINVP